MSDPIKDDVTLNNNLDHWYGGPKKVGIRDIVVGLTFVAVIVLTMVIIGIAKDMKQQAFINSHVTCPNCGHEFVPQK